RHPQPAFPVDRATIGVTGPAFGVIEESAAIAQSSGCQIEVVNVYAARAGIDVIKPVFLGLPGDRPGRLCVSFEVPLGAPRGRPPPLPTLDAAQDEGVFSILQPP